MSYKKDEVSVSDGNPIECYRFSYNNQYYLYTSSQYRQALVINGTNYVFNAEYIKRGDNLKLGDSGGTVETCEIEVLRTNPVALLYQGAPPELSSVNVEVFRVHGEHNNEYIKIIDGIVSQVRFNNSIAILTITIENVLNRYIPKGTLSYSCQNCIYDDKCNLDESMYALTCYIDGGIDGLSLYSTNLREKPSGYFTDGYMRMGNSVRAIKIHKDNMITIKYPINRMDIYGSFIVYPGCSQLFSNCARKFHNTDNFNGIPYIPPYDARKHETGRGVYWVNGNIVVRDTNGNITTPSF